MIPSLKPVSIVIPIKNRGKFLPSLIKNLSDLNYPNYEIIIVDDSSTDNTTDLLQQFAIKSILLKKSVGSAQARNIGIKQAKHDIIALTDSDCLVSKNWLKDLVPYLENYDAVGGNVIYSDKAEMKLNPLCMKNETIITKESSINFLNFSNIIFKKNLLTLTGGFLDYRIEDLDFSWRLLKKGFNLIYVPKGTIIHYANRTPIQNIKKYLQYGKSYTELIFVHQMNLGFKPEPVFSRNSILNYSQLIIYPIVLLFLLFICNLMNFNYIFCFSLSTLLIFLFGYLMIRLIKKIEFFYKLYKICIISSIVIYSMIYLLKKK
ncbi:MAG: glycosyltransferase [Promethearchaeota archaeon]